MKKLFFIIFLFVSITVFGQFGTTFYNNPFWFMNGKPATDSFKITIGPDTTELRISGAWKFTPSLSISGLGGWSLTGNTGTDTSLNFFGTTDVMPVRFRIAGINAGLLDFNNTFYGLHSGNTEVTGVNNTGHGISALHFTRSGSRNTALGESALRSNTTGNDNTAIGLYALRDTLQGSGNLALGAYSMRYGRWTYKCIIDTRDRLDSVREARQSPLVIDIGTDSSLTKLRANGKLQISDGTAGEGKVYASDVTGIGSWTNIITVPDWDNGLFGISNGTATDSTPLFGIGGPLFNSTPFYGHSGIRLKARYITIEPFNGGIVALGDVFGKHNNTSITVNDSTGYVSISAGDYANTDTNGFPLLHIFSQTARIEAGADVKPSIIIGDTLYSLGTTIAQWKDVYGLRGHFGNISESSSGTYTPTLSNTTNVSASTAYVTGYMRVGNQVTVGFKVDIDVTLAASAATELGFQIPVASNFTGEEDLGGTAASDAIASLVVRVKADPTNDRASFVFKAISLTNDSFNGSFTYIVK